MGQFIILSIQILKKSIEIPIANPPWADCKALNVKEKRADWKIQNYFLHVMKAISYLNKEIIIYFNFVIFYYEVETRKEVDYFRHKV